MTFCAKNENIEIFGRADNLGSLIWLLGGVCELVASGTIKTQGEITSYKKKRTGQTTLLFLPSGALGARMKAGRKIFCEVKLSEGIFLINNRC